MKLKKKMKEMERELLQCRLDMYEKRLELQEMGLDMEIEDHATNTGDRSGFIGVLTAYSESLKSKD